MRNFKIFLTIFFSIISQTIGATIDIRSTHLTTNEGLGNNSIRYIYQDKKGFIWFATLNGLSRYDGYSFITFRPELGSKISLTDHRITNLEEDKNGFLWINTSAELFSCFDLKKDCFVDFTGCGEYKEPYKNKIIDKKGNVWLWHDGNGIRKVIYSNGKMSSISFKKEKGNIHSNKVVYLFEDKTGRIWIGTKEGIELINGDKTIVVEKKHEASKIIDYDNKVYFLSTSGNISINDGVNKNRLITTVEKKYSNTIIYSTFKLKEYWIIFTNNGSYSFNFKTHELSEYKDINIKKGQVLTDNHGDYWVYNHTGKVWYINKKKNNIKALQLIPSNKVNFIDQERYHIVHDSRDIIWISTYGNGLFAYNLSTEEIQHFESDNTGYSHIPSNFLQFIMEDKTGGIWVSSEYTGISHLLVLNEGAKRIFPESESHFDRSNAMKMFKKMPNEQIIVGTRRGGVYNYDYKTQSINDKKYYNSNIYSTEIGPDGKIWLGSRGDGLMIDGKWYVNNPSDNNSLSNNNIFTIIKDSKNRMWIGTFGGGLDLAIKDKDGYHFKHFFNKTYSQKQIRVIEQDKKGWLWVGTSDGVYIFNPDSLISSPESYYSYNYNNGKMLSNEIKCIFQDSKGRMWLGASGKGFCICTPNGDYKNPTFKYYNTSNGLVNDMVQTIVEDKYGKFWISTEYGISCFDPEKESFDNFFFSSFTLGNVYSENCGGISKDGKLIFGTNYGLVVITPEKVSRKSKFFPKVEFTNLRINGINMLPGDSDSPLSKALIYTDELKLKYSQNSFEIRFSIFDYFGNNVTKYSYKLDNYDSQWSIPSSLNIATYKNLSPGTYKLRVKACNGIGVWGEEESVIDIVIVPPFWKTTWAIIIYALLLGIILFITLRLINNFNSLRNKINVEKQMTEYKLVFFTNISHEFRTPLSLIQCALERIESNGKVPKEIANSLQIMDKSTQRMLRLINQLLVFRKIQNDKFSLSLEEVDVIDFLYNIFLCFNDAALSKNMYYKFNPLIDSYKMFIDKGALDKVTYNLLSNSFKYTPKGGTIELKVDIDKDSKQIKIIVSDSGVGIPKEKRGELFERFTQSNFTGGSIGVGLHLTHELVAALKGNISYIENDNGGSIFVVSLPIDKSIYDKKDFLIPNNILIEEEEEKENNKIPFELANIENDEHLNVQPLNKHKILIIEDDHDIRDYLKSEIEQYFEIETEADGESGLNRAMSYDADLIICDVLMPGMDGYTVTRKLKSDFNTSHIPVILLTAMSSTENQIEGSEAGADAYITKPFSIKLLLTRIFKLIEQREKLREKFSNSPNMTSSTICTSEKDKEFADKLKVVLEKQFENPEFSVDDFASIIGLGRTVFYRKVRGVTGYSPNEYIRIMRMKKGAELLKQNRYTISEISYKIGINDPFYFSKCFKQQFGVSPSAYIKGYEESNNIEEN